MPRYLMPDGEIQTLTRRAARDVAAGITIREVDASGEPVPVAASTLATEIEHLRAHEQVGLLQAALVEAQARVQDIETQLAAAEVVAKQEAAKATADAAARDAEATANAQRDADADNELIRERG